MQSKFKRDQKAQEMEMEEDEEELVLAAGPPKRQRLGDGGKAARKGQARRASAPEGHGESIFPSLLLS